MWWNWPRTVSDIRKLPGATGVVYLFLTRYPAVFVRGGGIARSGVLIGKVIDCGMARGDQSVDRTTVL